MIEKKIIFIGAGDFGREIMYSALDQNLSVSENTWKPIAFIDEDPAKIGTKLEGIDVIALEEVKALADKDTYFIVTVGSPYNKEAVINKLLGVVEHAKFAKVIHRCAEIMPNTKIEDGVYIGPHTTIAIGCHIKFQASINFNVSMGHDCVIGEYAVVGPGCLLSGHTEIAKKVYLGSGVITYPNVKIGNESAVSAGIAVSRSIPDFKKMILKPNTMTIPAQGAK